MMAQHFRSGDGFSINRSIIGFFIDGISCLSVLSKCTDFAFEKIHTLKYTWCELPDSLGHNPSGELVGTQLNNKFSSFYGT
jgi:hypothetical protein